MRRTALLAATLAVVFVGGIACRAEHPAPSGREAVRGVPPLTPAEAVEIARRPKLAPASAPAPSSQPAPAGAPASAPIAAEAAEGGQVLEGTIEVAPALAAQVKDGDVLFLSAKPVDADGVVQRVPIAVDRIVVAGLPIHFRLSAGNVMMSGTPFSGAVLLIARDDRDGDAMTRTAGDVEGTLKATIPAHDLKIVLDTPVAQ